MTLTGSEFADLFFASRRDDRLEGRGGDDVIFARGGDDTILGGRGNDIVVGGDGDDEAIWNNGDGCDLVFGGRGHDRQTVNLADDAGDAITLTNIGSFVQLARTNLGVFSLDLFGTEALAVNGGGGDDTFALANDVAAAIELEIDGGADGADHRRADDAGDIARGDTVDLSSFATGVLVDLDENNQGVLQAENDLSNATDAGLSEFGKIEVDGEVVVEQLDDVENAIGTAFDDTLFGNSQNNVLLGGAGNDQLIGGDNVDRARADAEDHNADTLNGGAGNDLLVGGKGADTFAFASGEGADVIDDFDIHRDVIALDAPSFDVHADEV
ncbi:MAG: hypothetical protein GVY33_01145, partial [Alphaproteobacteria bacterium]|nr:hypothetical protein [Alphaproteobacteria bacterium]